MRKSFLTVYVCALAWLGTLIPAVAATNEPPHVYASDTAFAIKLGHELYETLDASFQRKLGPEVIFAEELEAPEITPVMKSSDARTPGQVLISSGYVSLINHVAHAKAIDRIQPGYFKQYIANLARETDGENPPDLPNMTDSRYWTDSVMNDQASYFNQMMGLTMAINLSHHYLGHYRKYSAQMLAGKLAPINDFILPVEWDASVKAAALNSLDCALGAEGGEALFAAIDQMPRRPAWTAYIVPLNVDIKKLNNQLAKYERAYFHGGLKVGKVTADTEATEKTVVLN